MGMLTMDVEKEIGGFLELRQRRRAAVDEGTRAAAGIDYAAQDQRAVISSETGFIEPSGKCGQTVDGEPGGNFGTGGAAAHHPAFGTVAQCQGERVDQDGFAGPGLAGEHGQPGLEIQLDRLDQQVVADGKVRQHGDALCVKAFCPSAASAAGYRSSCRRAGATG